MEEKNQKYLNIKSKSQLYFGPYFSDKIQNLKVFIYGLKGVIKYHYSNIILFYYKI